jgi:WD40 repeat protein
VHLPFLSPYRPMKFWISLLFILLGLYGCGVLETPTPTIAPSETLTATPTVPPSATPTPSPQAVLIARLGQGIPQKLAWSPDGAILAVASSTGVYLYEAESYTEIGLVADGSWVTAIRFSADGSQLALGLNDGGVRVWDLRSSSFVRTLEGSRSGVSSLDFSPDGHLLAIGRLDSTLWLWDLNSGQVLHRLRGHRDRITGVSFGPALDTGGYQLATCSRDGTLVVWDSSSGQSIAYFDLHEGSVNQVAFRPGLRGGGERSLVASASDDATIRYWDAETNTMQLIFLEATNGLRSLAFDSAYRLLAGGDSRGKVWFWDAETGQPLQSFDASARAGIVDIAFRPNSSRLATLGEDATVKIWNLVLEDIRTSTSSPAHTLPGYASAVNGISGSPAGGLLASAHADGSIRLWNLETGELITSLGNHIGAATSISFHPDGDLIVSSGNDGMLMVWSAQAALESRPALVRQLAGHQNAIFQASFTPDGNQIASVGADGTLRYWSTFSGTQQQLLKSVPNWLYSLAFSSNGHWLVDGSSRGELQIWQIAGDDLTAVPALVAHSGAVIRLAFSPDSTYLASSGDDAQIKLWKTADFSLLETLLGHSRRVSNLVFSPDGSFLASSGADATIRIWAMDSYIEVLAIEDHWPAGGLAFEEQIAINIFLLLSGNSDGTIKVWRVLIP